jgi:hypothetical protein
MSRYLSLRHVRRTIVDNVGNNAAFMSRINGRRARSRQVAGGQGAFLQARLPFVSYLAPAGNKQQPPCVDLRKNPSARPSVRHRTLSSRV